MSDYTQRATELAAQYEALKPRMNAIEFIRVAAVEKSLMDARQTALNAIEAVLCEDGDDTLADELRQKEDYARDNLLVPFGRMLYGMSEPSTALDLWVEGNATIERRFFQGLSDLKLAEARDRLIDLDKKLKAMIAVLDRKWSTMSEENQRLEALEAAASDEMTRIVKNALDQGTDWWARWGDSFNKALAYFMKIPELADDAIVYLAIEAGVPENVAKLLPKISLVGKDTFAKAKELGIPAGDVAKALPFLLRNVGMAVSETLQKALGPEFEMLVSLLNELYKNVLPFVSGEYNRQLSILQSLLPNQGSVLVSFSQTRADVDQFLKDNGLDKVANIYDAAIAGLDRWADAQGSDALKSNAQTMAREVKAAFRKRAEATTHNFDEFVRANSGRFVGRVEQKTEDALLWTGLWTQREDGIRQLRMDEKLQMWRATTMHVTDAFADATSQVDGKLSGLSDDLRDNVKSALDAYMAGLRDKLKSPADQSSAAMETAQRTVASDQIKRDFDRSVLRQRLYA